MYSYITSKNNDEALINQQYYILSRQMTRDHERLIRNEQLTALRNAQAKSASDQGTTNPQLQRQPQSPTPTPLDASAPLQPPLQP